MEYRTIIEDLAALGERQFKRNRQAAGIITRTLEEASVPHAYETYLTQLPEYVRAEVSADGVAIPCQGSGLVSGQIDSADALISSLISSQQNPFTPNLNFNPRCKEISRSNHYFAPALSIAAADVSRVLAAQQVRGVLEVERRDCETGFFLVGNREDPETIVFSHFDSIGPGAVDNASGVALTMQLIIGNPSLLERVLFVIDGNEELSYDVGIYWGYGYRVFEERYLRLLDGAERLLVLDSFGYSAPELITDIAILTLALPLREIQHYSAKMKLLSGSYEGLMSFYHASNDLPELIDDDHWTASKRLIERELGRG
jgi:hypothetical protein